MRTFRSRLGAGGYPALPGPKRIRVVSADELHAEQSATVMALRDVSCRKAVRTEASMEEPNTWKCLAGTFVGYEDRGCQQVRGIRYASSERYGAPVPYVYGPGVHECIEPAPYSLLWG